MKACNAKRWVSSRATPVLKHLMLILTLLQLGAGLAQAHDVVMEEVRFQSGEVTLEGTLLLPSGNEPRPGVVLVHGAGPTLRGDYLAEAEAFAQAGIAALIYDKRTEGYSFIERSYALLADDALSAVRLLRDHPEVDPARVGLWGLSEGGWVAPLAAARSSEVAFLITVAGTGVPPAQQEAWAKANRLRQAGVSRSLLWAYPVTGTRLAVGAGLFAEAHHDPVPVLAQVHQPVLAIWGEHDIVSPPGESLNIFRRVLEQSGNPHVTLRILPEATHSARHTQDGGLTTLDDFAPSYLESMTSWVNALADASPIFSADTPPPQLTTSTPLAPLSWHESATMQLAAFVISLVVFAGYLLTGLVARRRSRTVHPARWLAIAGLATVLGAFVYFGYLLMTNEQAPGPILFGRPLPWLALQLLAMIAVVALIATIPAWWRARADFSGWSQLRLGLLLVGGALFVPWALYWGLLVP